MNPEVEIQPMCRRLEAGSHITPADSCVCKSSGIPPWAELVAASALHHCRLCAGRDPAAPGEQQGLCLQQKMQKRGKKRKKTGSTKRPAGQVKPPAPYRTGECHFWGGCLFRSEHGSISQGHGYWFAFGSPGPISTCLWCGVARHLLLGGCLDRRRLH